MELEQRVTLLEQEIQILKNQIQATLLDIQEHLLTNAYPSLRADDDAPPPGPPPVRTISANPDAAARLDEGRASPAPHHDLAVAPVPARRALDPAPAAPPREANPPRRSANGAAHEAIALSQAADDDFPARVPPGALETSADWALMEQLIDWTNRRVTRYGARHTRELIAHYAAQGRIPPTVRDALLQIIAIGTAPPDPSAAPLALVPAPDDPPDSDELVSPNLILRLIAGIATVGTGRSRSAKSHG